MSKIYFVMKNRENTGEGYREVSEEELRNYIASFPEGERAYFINLGYALMETDEAGYRSFYKEYRRERYGNVLSITGSSCYATTGNGYNDTSGDGYSTGMDRG